MRARLFAVLLSAASLFAADAQTAPTEENFTSNLGVTCVWLQRSVSNWVYCTNPDANGFTGCDVCSTCSRSATCHKDVVVTNPPAGMPECVLSTDKTSIPQGVGGIHFRFPIDLNTATDKYLTGAFFDSPTKRCHVGNLVLSWANAANFYLEYNGVARLLNPWPLQIENDVGHDKVEVRLIPKLSCFRKGCDKKTWKKLFTDTGVEQALLMQVNEPDPVVPCFCDDACTKFVDCCIDYMFECAVWKPLDTLGLWKPWIVPPVAPSSSAKLVGR